MKLTEADILADPALLREACADFLRSPRAYLTCYNWVGRTLTRLEMMDLAKSLAIKALEAIDD